jgi:hypothetical protein
MFARLVPVNDSEIYPIITSSYMAAGGDGYEMWADKKVCPGADGVL